MLQEVEFLQFHLSWLFLYINCLNQRSKERLPAKFLNFWENSCDYIKAVHLRIQDFHTIQLQLKPDSLLVKFSWCNDCLYQQHIETTLVLSHPNIKKFRGKIVYLMLIRFWRLLHEGFRLASKHRLCMMDQVLNNLHWLRYKYSGSIFLQVIF